jgi:hypothetical protein
MPDVGLTTATEPVPSDEKVTIKYSVEIGMLPVYSETYDVEKIAGEIVSDRKLVKELWMRRLEAVVHSRDRPQFSASVTAFLAGG